MLHFASKVVTFRVDVTFSFICYILRRNSEGGGSLLSQVPRPETTSSGLEGFQKTFRTSDYAKLNCDKQILCRQKFGQTYLFYTGNAF